jgi:hypothetical protein
MNKTYDMNLVRVIDLQGVVESTSLDRQMLDDNRVSVKAKRVHRCPEFRKDVAFMLNREISVFAQSNEQEAGSTGSLTTF